MEKSFLLVIIFLLTFSVFSASNVYDNKAINLVADYLIWSYDQYEDTTLTERFVLKLGRNAFIDSVNFWRNNYARLGIVEMPLHPKMVDISYKIGEVGGDQLRIEFVSLMKELTILGFENCFLYYNVVISEDDFDDIDRLTPVYMEKVMSKVEFYDEKIDLYSREAAIVSKVSNIFNMDIFKYKLIFYRFAFNFLNDIRTSIIEKDISVMKEKLEELPD